jgi:hypothetical protein
MHSKIKVALATALLTAIGTACYINPKFVSTTDNGRVILLCGIKRVWVQRSSPDGFSAGLQSWGDAVDGVLDKLTQKTVAELAGNPFSGLGVMIIENMKPGLKSIAERGFEDTCKGRSTQWLNDLSNSLNSISQ